MRLPHLARPALLTGAAMAAAAAAAFVALPADGALTSSGTGRSVAAAAATVEGSVSGFTIGEIAYHLAPDDAALLAGVTFSASPAPAAGGVRVQLAPGGRWYPCTAAGTAVRCTTAGTGLAAVEQLSVVATG